MAVEARHLNLFHPQILSNRDMMLNGTENINNFYGAGVSPMLFPIYGTDVMETVQQPTTKNCTMRSESGLTYAPLPVVSRKRFREDSNNSINMNQLVSFPSSHQNHNRSSQFTFLGEDFSSQIQRQQLEVDSFIAHHNEKVRLEIEERRKSYSRRIMGAVEEGMSKKLKAKEDEIQKMVRWNYTLEERVKSLCMENQIWRDLAQRNEATANVLRSNLEQVVAQVQNGESLAGLMAEDAQSCCGSNEIDEDNTVAESSFREESGGECKNLDGVRLCRRCGKDEACVLLLPCRHLCLCSACGSSQHICPLCNSTKSCSLHVNFSC